MQLLYCDESNFDQWGEDFFVYGGVVIDSSAAPGLSAGVEAGRSAKQVSPEFKLKFNPPPDHLDHESFKDLKGSILNAAAENRCTLLLYVTLQRIAKNREHARLYGINTVCYHFDCWLKRKDDYGLVLVDRFDPNQADSHLREKFSTGVTGLPHSSSLRLERILGFHYAAIGQSHFSTVTDIAISSFRYAVNSFTRGGVEGAAGASALLNLLSPLFARDHNDRVLEISLTLSPKTITVPTYREKYQELKDFFAQNGLHVVQEITECRRY